ncbi:hypothetical protein [Mucilaginibacter sp.]
MKQVFILSFLLLLIFEAAAQRVRDKHRINIPPRVISVADASKYAGKRIRVSGIVVYHKRTNANRSRLIIVSEIPYATMEIFTEGNANRLKSNQLQAAHIDVTGTVIEIEHRPAMVITHLHQIHFVKD